MSVPHTMFVEHKCAWYIVSTSLNVVQMWFDQTSSLGPDISTTFIRRCNNVHTILWQCSHNGFKTSRQYCLNVVKCPQINVGATLGANVATTFAQRCTNVVALAENWSYYACWLSVATNPCEAGRYQGQSYHA